jgi:hypothetical protein
VGYVAVSKELTGTSGNPGAEKCVADQLAPGQRPRGHDASLLESSCFQPDITNVMAPPQLAHLPVSPSFAAIKISPS